MREKVFSGILWKFLERFFAQGVSFIVSIILARLLLPEDYGTIVLVSVFVEIANVFVVSGLSTALIQKKDANEVDFSTIFYCSLILSILLYLVLFFLAPYISRFYKEPFLRIIIRVFSLKIIFHSYSSVQHAYIERKMLFKKYFWSTSIGTFISGIVGIALAFYGYGVWALIAQLFTNTIIDILVLNFTIDWRPKKLFSIQAAKELVAYGWKILVADLIGTVFERLRTLLIGKYYLPTDLAFYNKGQQIPSLVSTNITAAIMSVLFPAFSNFNDEIGKVKIMLRKSVRLMSYIIFPILIFICFSAKQMILLLLTQKWIESVPYLQILSLSAIFSMLGSVSLQAVKAIGRSDVILKIELIKKPIYIIVLIIGIKISVFWTAITMLLYSIYACIINAYQLKKFLNYSFGEQFQDLLEASVLSIIMGFGVWWIGQIEIPILWCFLLQIILAGIIYLGISCLFKSKSLAYILELLKLKQKSE